MSTLWGGKAPAGLSRGSWSLLKPKMTSMLWTRPPAAMPPPFPISWKLLGERQLSSTMLMVSSDKCIRASGYYNRRKGVYSKWWTKSTVSQRSPSYHRCLSSLHPSKPAYPLQRHRGWGGDWGVGVKSLSLSKLEHVLMSVLM